MDSNKKEQTAELKDQVLLEELEEYDIIKMVPCNYTKTSSDFHLNRLNYILQECPPFLNKANRKNIYYVFLFTLHCRIF